MPDPRPAGFKRWITLLVSVLALGFALLVLSTGSLVQFGPALELSDRLADLKLVPDEFGGYDVVVGRGEGEVRFDAEEFIAQVAERQKAQTRRGWLYRVFDITSWTGILWVTFGFGGQALFTGRMLIQWIASEKQRQSVVPVAFWWMSLTGATMLMMYFIWRVEIVGLLGQSTGFFVYVRNLVLIYRPKAVAATGGEAGLIRAVEDPAPEPIGAMDGPTRDADGAAGGGSGA